jgi:hypothetical protein
MEPPLYTATNGGTNSPDPGLGPKLLPPSTTSVPPDVDITPTADVTTGIAYVRVGTDHDPFCPPTSTRHCRPPPTPATLLHWAVKWPDPVTTHDDAKYSTPYTAFRYTTRSVADVGPKLLPASCTLSPPAVLRPPALALGNDDTTAAVYDVVTVLHTPTTPPTVTRHTCPYPTPTALTHCTRLWAASTTHPVAVYTGPPINPDPYSTTTSDPPVPNGPMFDPAMYTVSPPAVVSALPPVVADPTRTPVTADGTWVMVFVDAALV